MDTTVFYPEKRSSAVEAAVAVATCQACPIRTACLEYAQAAREPYGIWGGLDAKQRANARRRAVRQAEKAVDQ
jgi:WhiB family redox-sensing transcriptional regulator